MRQGNTSWVGPGSAIARPESHLGIPPCSEGTMHEETLQRSGHDTQRANAGQDFLLRSADNLGGHETSIEFLSPFVRTSLLPMVVFQKAEG